MPLIFVGHENLLFPSLSVFLTGVYKFRLVWHGLRSEEGIILRGELYCMLVFFIPVPISQKN